MPAPTSIHTYPPEFYTLTEKVGVQGEDHIIPMGFGDECKKKCKRLRFLFYNWQVALNRTGDDMTFIAAKRVKVMAQRSPEGEWRLLFQNRSKDWRYEELRMSFGIAPVPAGLEKETAIEGALEELGFTGEMEKSIPLTPISKTQEPYDLSELWDKAATPLTLEEVPEEVQRELTQPTAIQICEPLEASREPIPTTNEPRPKAIPTVHICIVKGCYNTVPQMNTNCPECQELRERHRTMLTINRES